MAIPDYKSLKEKWSARTNSIGSPDLDALIAIALTSGTDFNTEVALGHVEGYSLVSVQGENLDVDAAAPENLWCEGGLMSYPLQPGEQWELYSTNSGDTVAGGAGAQVVLLDYMDSNYNVQSEVIAMNGVLSVPTVATNCFRLIAITTIAKGSTGSNIGAVGARQVGNGLVRGCMAPTYNRTAHGFYTVPLGYTAYFLYGHAAMGKGKDAKTDLFIAFGDSGVFTRSPFADLYQNSVTFLPAAPIGSFVEKSDLQFRCTTLSGNADASAFMQLMLIDNSVL